MYRDRVVRILAAPLVAALLAPEMLAQTDVAARPPVAMKTPHVTTVHGDTLKDDYFWLREKSNPKVISYLEAENAYTEEMMKPTKGLHASGSTTTTRAPRRGNSIPPDAGVRAA